MKILQILPSLELGGVERGAVDFARALKRRGHECVVISSGGELVKELQKMGTQHYELPVHQKSIFSLGLVSRLAEVIEREKIDLIHARSRVPAWLAWFAARRTGRPLVTTCHGYYSKHLLSRVMGWGKRVIVISNVIGRHMIDDFGVSPEKIRLIHRGVDLAQFDAAKKYPEKSTGPKKFRVINVGRLSPIKGQFEFLQAVHELRRSVPDLEVLIVGSENGNKYKYTELLHRTIQQLNLGSCVKLLGTRRDIPELLAQSDLLVLSTIVPEAFGRVIIEAGAVGTPVVATKQGGVLDIIDHEKNGLLVTPGDTKEMAEAMRRIAQDPEKAGEYAKNLKQKVQAEFSVDQMTDKTLKVYEEVMAEKKILVIKLGAAGDLILAVPSLRMIRERFPQAKIFLMTDQKIAGLVSQAPYLDDMILVNRAKLSNLSYLLKTAKKIRREGFDISVDLQNSKWTYGLAFLGGVRERYGFARGKFKFLLNRPDQGFGIVDTPVRHQFRILSKLGVRELDEELELWADPKAEERLKEMLPETEAEKDVKWIGMVVGSSPSWPSKRWPPEYFQELAARLTADGKCRVALIGSKEDAVWAEKLSETREGVVSLIGKTSLTDLVALVKKMDVMVTGDTAPLHIGAAFQTKLVAIFGPTDPKRHMPPSRSATVLAKHLACQPCYEGKCTNPDELACLKQISVEEVYQAVRKQLAGKQAPVLIAGKN